MERHRSTFLQRMSDNETARRAVPSYIEPVAPLIANPFMRPYPQKGTNLMELFEEDSECAEPELVQVYLRLKPSERPSNLYEVHSDKCLITSTDTATAGHGRKTQHNVSKMYTFSHIFRPESNQKEIFDHIVKDNLQKLIEGHSYTLLTYGASGSGKTYTLMGTVSEPGLVPRSLEYLFKIINPAQVPLYKPSEASAEKLNYAEQEYEMKWVKKLRQVSAPQRDKYRRMSVQLSGDMTTSSIDLTDTKRHYVWVSFVEIYNEAVYDLLTSADRRSAASKLRIREDASGQVYVQGASQAFVRTGTEAYDMLVAGKHNLQVAATGVHARSSRSHCIFTITLVTETESGPPTSSCVRLCDLAGAERVARTGNTGTRMLESRAINASLHVLERCLHTLRRRNRVQHSHLVPYRESKLTRLLGAGLSGARGEAVSMVVTINPDPKYANETKHVLQLAAVAKDIQINYTLSDLSSLDSVSHETTMETDMEVMKLRAEVERLRFELAQSRAAYKQLLNSMEESQRRNAEVMREVAQEAKDILHQYYKAQIENMEEEHRAAIEELTEEYESKIRPPADMPQTPSSQQKIIAQLAKKNAILEEQLNSEKFARQVAEEEVQHLRACIDERDNEKHSDEEIATQNTTKPEVIIENEEISDDEMNESLEPSFRVDTGVDTTQQSVEAELSDVESDISNETTKKSRISDMESDISNETTKKSIIENSVTDKSSSYETVKNDTSEIYDSIDDSKNKSVQDKPSSRATYVINETINSSDAEIGKVNISFEGKTIGAVSKNLLNKYRVSDEHRSSGPDQSLAVFEKYENDFISDDEPVKKRDPSRFFNFDKLKDKRNYFSNDSAIDTSDVEPEPITINDTRPDINDTFKVAPKEHKTYFDYEGDDKTVKKLEKRVTETVVVTEKEPVKTIDFFDDGKVVKEKKTYFDEPVKTEKAPSVVVKDTEPIKIPAAVKLPEVDRSPSIVKDEMPKDYDPTTIKKLLGDTKKVEKAIPKIRLNSMSVDILEEGKSTKLVRKSVIESKVMEIEKSVQRISLIDKPEPSFDENSRTDIKKEDHENNDTQNVENEKVAKIDVEKPETVTEDPNKTAKKGEDAKTDIKKDDQVTKEASNVEKDKVSKTDNFLAPDTKDQKNESLKDASHNTIEDFENIYKDITAPRPTQFDLLLTNELDETNTDRVKKELSVTFDEKKDRKEESKRYNLRQTVNIKEKQVSEEEKTSDDKTKYNLRNKDEIEEKPARRTLRLRRRQNDAAEENKLKDIANLQKEFSDVTLDIPAPVKVVKDIPSPEKKGDENLKPVNELLSCPSKSVTRSRRKLFTPRAEPLDESLTNTGDSTERVRIPRPSYHGPRARRRL